MEFIKEKSFFEYLRMADSERVHSEFITWFISQNCNAIDNLQKLDFLKQVFAIKDTRIINSGTEIKNIDIFIETESSIIIIENKLKSSQHSNQLKKYKEYVKKEFPNKLHKFIFLTLINEQKNVDEWQHASYYKILLFLNKLKLKSHKHSVFVKDYILYLKRLLFVLKDLLNNSKKYESVFTNGSLTKKEKFNMAFNSEEEKFISENQLETILQKAFLTKLLEDEEIQKLNGIISETHGVALINFPLKTNIKVGTNKNYKTFIQIQGENIKFAFSIQEDYLRSQKKWILDIVDIFKSYKDIDTFDFNKFNTPKSKAYVSISKKMNKPYWLLSKKEVQKMILDEIENGKKLTERLLIDIKNTVGNKV